MCLNGILVNAVWKCLPRCSPHANNFQLFFLANVPHLVWALSSVCFVSIKAFVRVQIKRIFKIKKHKVAYRKAIKKGVRRENRNISNMHGSILFIFLLSLKIPPSFGCCNGRSSLGRGCGYTRCYLCNWRSLRSLDRTNLEFWIRSCDMRWSESLVLLC